MAATSTAKKSRPAPARMPIDDYDRLSVKAIVPRLAGLTGTELQAVVAYEKAGKNRVTLLQAARKVELAREAAARRAAPESRLTVVEDYADDDEDAEGDATENAAYSDDEEAEYAADADDWGPDAMAEDTGWETADFAAYGDDEDTAEDTDEGAAAPYAAYADEEYADDSEIVEVAEEPVVAPVPAPAKSKRGTIGVVARPAAARPTAPKAKKKSKATTTAPEPVAEKKSRTAVKAATWEEELRPQLPRRIESAAAAYELEFEPTPMALVPPIEPMTASTTSPAATTAAHLSGPAKVRRKFEGAALVMAAVLAVLLGLAIGTILARSGSVSAQPNLPGVVSEAVAVQAGG